MNVCESDDQEGINHVVEKDDDVDNQNAEGNIELEPFIHQVGGRSAILTLGDCVCKQINERELLFYENLDQYAPLLKPFVCDYKGVIVLKFEESDDGYLVVTTKPSYLTDVIATTASSSNDKSIQNHSKTTTDSVRPPGSPYQKFVTKYRIRLCRPLKEVIIESHEQDVDEELELSRQNLENIFKVQDSSHSDIKNPSSKSSQMVVSSGPSNDLIRSRSTSVSLPNFEDVNFFCQPELTNIFDNNHISSNDSGKDVNSNVHQNPQFCRQPSGTSSPTKKHVYSPSPTKHNPWVLKTFSSLSEFNESMKEQSTFWS